MADTHSDREDIYIRRMSTSDHVRHCIHIIAQSLNHPHGNGELYCGRIEPPLVVCSISIMRRVSYFSLAVCVSRFL